MYLNGCLIPWETLGCIVGALSWEWVLVQVYMVDGQLPHRSPPAPSISAMPPLQSWSLLYPYCTDKMTSKSCPLTKSSCRQRTNLTHRGVSPTGFPCQELSGSGDFSTSWVGVMPSLASRCLCSPPPFTNLHKPQSIMSHQNLNKVRCMGCMHWTIISRGLDLLPHLRPRRTDATATTRFLPWTSLGYLCICALL